MQTDKQTVLWRRLALIAFILTAALVWIALDTWLGLVRTDARVVEIPSCTGHAADALSLPEWLDVTVEYRYDDKIPEGTVITQSPAGGARRKLPANASTCALLLVVSLGKEQITLPQTVGSDARTVTADLRAEGLQVHVVTQAASAPEGRVLAMQPPAGTVLARGDGVTLTVSAGTPTQTVKVPDLTGLSRADALVELWLSHLAVGEVIEIDADGAVGTVVRQSHRAGTTVRAGTRIILYISMQD
ncbi:MAG: PASTA domain-containing protein [Clostridia bacterium]|nr:PASTA domain-containing protein [Clostridia bacterium]